MNIYNIIEKDHTCVYTVLKALEKDPLNKELFQKLEHIVISHEEAKNSIFYEFFKQKLDYYNSLIEASLSETSMIFYLIKFYNNAQKDEEKSMIIRLIKSSLEGKFLKEKNEIFQLAKNCFTHNEEEELAAEFKMKRKI